MQFISVIYLTMGVLILLLGILIFRDNPNRRLNRVTGSMMFFTAIVPIMISFSLLIQQVPAASEFDLSLFHKIFLIWEFFFPQLLLFSMLFPKENQLVQYYYKITPLLFLPHLVRMTIVLIFKSPESILALIELTSGGSRIFLQPIFLVFNLILSLLSYIYEFQKLIFSFINIVYFILAAFIMYRGYQEIKSPPLHRRAKVIFWGIIISVGLYIIGIAVPQLLAIEIADFWMHGVILLALIIGPVAIILSIIKYQFLDITMFFRRGIIFSITSGLVVGIYLLIYGQAKHIFNSLFGVNVPAIEIIFLILAIIFFQPVLSYLERIVQKLFEQEKTDNRKILQELSHDLLHIIEIDELKHKVISNLKQMMKLEQVRLILSTRESEYIVEPPLSDKPNENIFDKNSPFISLMTCIKEPLSADEVDLNLVDQREFAIIKNINAELFFPLCHHNALNGILCIGKRVDDTKFSTEDITSLKALSDQISIALENSELHEQKLEKQRIEEELALSSEIQRMLLPHSIPQGTLFEISALNVPSKEVGGDYYDFIMIDDHRLGIAIGDISGKGIPGALLMSNLQATFRSIAANSTNTSDVTSKINNQISKSTSAEKFATFFYGILDFKKYTFTYTNAGHNYPIHRQSDITCSYLTQSGLVIGVLPDYDYEEKRIKIRRGDFLVLYTDGITEAINIQRDEFSERHLLDIVCKSHANSAEELRNQIYEELIDFTHGINQYDDITLLVVQLI
ncbi:SpoIIE family protein phosphatase [candidate division KSB1 bacterium]|nr:SpoIIE family protein phosphatase [candidate division KSB1 bacterium]